MKTKHTPGPWRTTESRHHSQAITEHWIDSGTRKSMACLQVWDVNHNKKWRKEHPEAVKEWRQTLEEVKANARLIASAPELLAAALDYMSQFGQALMAHGIPFSADQKAADEKLRAAIARATGN